MADEEKKKKFHRNIYQVPTASNTRLDEAFDEIKYRELLYNRDKKELGIKIDDEFIIPKPRVDEFNVTYNEQDEIALKKDITVDTITAEGDHQGSVDWKSQTLFAETTEERTIILICEKDNQKESGYVGFFGGEIVELGQDVESHYQFSITSTGSRLLKGGTTNPKKARPCLVKYDNVYYYGIHFRESSPARIYHAGWSNIPGPISAPSYATYVDGDFSEIVDLDDDSETGTEVIEFNFASLDDIDWEFEGSKGINFRAGRPASVGSGVSQYYDYGEGIRLYSQRTNAATIAFHPEWASVVVSGVDVIPWRFTVDTDGGTLTLRVKNWSSTRSCHIVIFGSDEYANPMYSPQLFSFWVPAGSTNYTMTADNLPKGTYWIRQGDGTVNTQIEYYQLDVAQSAFDTTWVTGDNYGYDLGKGLIIDTHQDLSWKLGPQNDNNGIITVHGPTNRQYEDSKQGEALARLTVHGRCQIKIGFSKPADLPEEYDGYNPTVCISETNLLGDDAWQRAVTATITEEDEITYVTYNYTGPLGQTKTLFISTDGPVEWYNVSVDYPTIGAIGDILAEIITNLQETGEDGSPHIIRPNGPINKDALMKIANVALNSERQLFIDLSRCAAEPDCRDWTADEDLSKAFQGCSSLRKFIFPKEVIKCGQQPFLNCSFLREIEFNDEALQLGRNAEWTTVNQGYFSGARIKEVWLPKEIGSVHGSSNDRLYPLGSYIFCQNNVISYYIRPDSYFARNNSATDLEMIFANSSWGDYNTTATWNTFSYARSDFKIYLPCKRNGDGTWDTSNKWLYNTWLAAARQRGYTFGPLMNSQVLSDITPNVPSLKTTDRVADFFAPYDVDEMWYEPRGIER